MLSPDMRAAYWKQLLELQRNTGFSYPAYTLYGYLNEARRVVGKEFDPHIALNDLIQIAQDLKQMLEQAGIKDTKGD